MEHCTRDVKSRLKFLVQKYSAQLKSLDVESAWWTRAKKRLNLDQAPTVDAEILKVSVDLARDAFKDPKVYYFADESILPIHCLHLDMPTLTTLEEALKIGDVVALNDYFTTSFSVDTLPYMWIENAEQLENPPLAQLHKLFTRIGRLNEFTGGSRLATLAVELPLHLQKGQPSTTIFGQTMSRDQLIARTVSTLLVCCVGMDYTHIRPVTEWHSKLPKNIRLEVQKNFSDAEAEVMEGLVDFFQADLSLKLMTGDINDAHLSTTALVLETLNHANYLVDENGLIPFRKFYNNTALDFDIRDMKEDFIRLLKAKEEPSIFSFCQFPFLIDANFKSVMMQLEASIESEGAMRNAMFSSLFTGASRAENEHFLVLNINRENLVQSALREIGRSGSRLQRPLRVKFVGEEGIDEGGVRKEFFQMLCKVLLDPAYGMFTSSEDNTLWFVPDIRNSTNHREFKLIGQTLGLAVFNNVMLDVNFPKCLYRLLLKPESDKSLADLAEVDPGLAQGMHDLLNFEEEPDEGMTVEDIFCRTFTFEHDVFGEKVELELCKNGNERPLTGENREEFVTAVVDHVIWEAVKDNLNAFREGFLSVCNRPLFRSMQPEELELLVCGSATLNFQELKDTTRYDGYKETDEVIQYFWDVVCNDLNLDQQKQFLKFCTGSDKVPIRGLGDLRFVIGKNGDDSDMLPTAHTCFNHLLLPQYSTKERLHEKLLLAIQNCQGFGLK